MTAQLRRICFCPLNDGAPLMPRNIEIKAYARDFDEIRRCAEALSDIPCEVIPQEDIFFPVEKGRLKLRILARDRGQLIYYTRPNQEGPKLSEYHIAETSDPEGLKNILARAYGIRGAVKKIRYLYIVGQTRVHLDDVENLGKFMELEVVMRPEQPDAEGQKIAEDLMRQLGIASADLLEGAYMDMLENGARH
jgi:predicted adenylyl cyclase CyaB